MNMYIMRVCLGKPINWSLQMGKKQLKQVNKLNIELCKNYFDNLWYISYSYEK